MKGKRGISDVITTVLIILLALAAIVIVWQAIGGTVQTGADQITGQSACIDVQLSITNVKRGPVLPATTIPSINVTTTRGIESADLQGIKVIIVNAAGTSVNSTDFTTSLAGLPGQGESKLYQIAMGLAGTTLPSGTYTVKIAPKVGTTQCDVADTLQLTV